MNRRGFLSKLGVIAAGFSILPSATLYTRSWKVVEKPFICTMLNPEWENAPYELSFVSLRSLAFAMYRNDTYPLRFRYKKFTLDGMVEVR